MNHVPYAEMVKDHLKTCIVDIAASALKISPENFLKIEFRVQELVVEELLKNGSANITFDMNKRHRRYRYLLCDN